MAMFRLTCILRIIKNLLPKNMHHSLPHSLYRRAFIAHLNGMFGGIESKYNFGDGSEVLMSELGFSVS